MTESSSVFNYVVLLGIVQRSVTFLKTETCPQKVCFHFQCSRQPCCTTSQKIQIKLFAIHPPTTERNFIAPQNADGPARTSS